MLRQATYVPYLYQVQVWLPPLLHSNWTSFDPFDTPKLATERHL